MKFRFRLPIATLALSALALVVAPLAANAATPGSAQSRTSHGLRSEVFGPRGDVFVQTDSPTGNRIDVLAQGSGGTLYSAGSYSTGGNGGVESGSVVDHLASQNSLVYSAQSDELYAVNAGSDTISVFWVFGSHLILLQVLPSGGQFPSSIAARGNLIYVLNAGGAGAVQGFARFGPFLLPLPGASQSLGLDNTNPPNYLMSPGDIGFSPDGHHLIVTTKASGSDIDVFSVGFFGTLSTPVVNASTTPVPFAFTWGPGGSLVVAEALNSAVSTYTVNANGTLTAGSSVVDGQAALCWITPASGVDYVANAGSGTLSAYQVGQGGSLSLLGVEATTEAGPIDMAASPDGHYLYSEDGGAGAVDGFAVNPGGSLTSIGNVEGLGSGIEGIAAD
jgi:6-phosphogluconolactonase (cycloisomerase 2 family)